MGRGKKAKRGADGTVHSADGEMEQANGDEAPAPAAPNGTAAAGDAAAEGRGSSPERDGGEAGRLRRLNDMLATRAKEERRGRRRSRPTLPHSPRGSSRPPRNI